MAATTVPPQLAPHTVEHVDTVPASDERSYFRSVTIAWLVGIPLFATLVSVLVLAVGDASVGGAIAVGLFSGFWVAPLAGVMGIGVWAAKHHGPHG